ncbi:MAG: hypothetical protein PHF67_04090 [Candidatus Nanoarchaeia archaeon]|nr:hypothetical protein [Candidatus Nanoarchaeia archaeon]
MKKEILLIMLFVSILLSIFGVFGAEKDLSASVQVIDENSQDIENPLESADTPYMELGTLKVSVENDLMDLSKQNLIQRAFSEGVHTELLSIKVEKFSYVFIYSIFVMVLFMVYIVFLLLKIWNNLKKKKANSFFKNFYPIFKK